MYPHDHHPLAPLLRKLRGAISWHQATQTPVPQAYVDQLMARCQQLPHAQVNAERRVLQIAHHWSTLPYLKTSDRYEETLDAEIAVDALPQSPEGPLPATEFPVVVHERHVIASVSFNESPPQDHHAKGSALLMRPSVNLKRHRGELPQAETLLSMDQAISDSGHDLATPDHVQSAPALWGQVSSPSAPIPSPAPSTSAQVDPRAQLWATQTPERRPDARPEAKSTSSNPKLGSSLTRLIGPTSTQGKPSKLPPSPKTKTSSNREAGSAHVRARGYQADERYAQICEQIWRCQSCPRHTERHLISAGHYGARIMFVVAHPNESDTDNGYLLMTQPERELFHQILKALSLSRMEVYITSLLKCGAALPNEQEWARCQTHFLNELELVQPEFIVSLGYMASIILLGGDARPGVWGRYQNLEVMPTLHPQDILSGGDGVKRKAWHHLKEVMRRAGLSSGSSMN